MSSIRTIGCSGDQATISVMGPISRWVSAPVTIFSSPTSSTFLMNARRSSKYIRFSSGSVYQVTDSGWIQRHPRHADTKRPQRIFDGIGDRGGDGQGAGLACALDG